MIRALPDFGSRAATSLGILRTDSPFNSVVNSTAFMPKAIPLHTLRQPAVRNHASIGEDCPRRKKRPAPEMDLAIKCPPKLHLPATALNSNPSTHDSNGF